MYDTIRHIIFGGYEVKYKQLKFHETRLNM